MVETDPQSRSTESFRQLLADMMLWLALLCLFVAFRATLFWIFAARFSPHPSWQALSRCFQSGLRSDVCTAMWAIFPSLVCTLIGFFYPLGRWHQRIRRATIIVVLTLCAIVFITDVGYFAEYGDQFNHWIFGLIYDDRRAILTTIWKSYPIVFLIFAASAGVAICSWLLAKLCRAGESAQLPTFLSARSVRLLAFLLAAVWALMGLRVWPGHRLVAVKNAGATGDVFLNKIVLNPFFALRYAIWQQRNMLKAGGLRTFLPDGDIRAAAGAIFPNAKNFSNLDDCLERKARGNPGPAPTHIFVVVMESYDAWAMQPEYAGLHLTDRLKELGEKGLRAQAFISSGTSTIECLGVIMTGLPYSRVLVNYQPIVREGLPTAAAPIFKQLGYKPRFFYGGFLSWERIGDFCREQGFEEVYGGDQMNPRAGGNEWGVDDEDLFRFILEHTGSEPTFDVIMSTSYHPPFSVDVEKKGFDFSVLKANPISSGLSQKQMKILGHLWYSDKCVTDFVSEGEHKLERPLFAITGDHYSRKQYVSARPMHTLYEEFAVPLVMHGPKALETVERAAALAGSHLDIVPTLINLAAPAGFIYHAFGRDLLDPSQPQIGFGCNNVIGPDFILRIGNPDRVENLRGEPVNGVDGESLAKHYRQLHALGWWRAMKGNQLPKNPVAALSERRQ
jgi:phosphoglycerol transferase MdoB-like AlkP superfamily enzyme